MENFSALLAICAAICPVPAHYDVTVMPLWRRTRFSYIRIYVAGELRLLLLSQPVILSLQ